MWTIHILKDDIQREQSTFQDELLHVWRNIFSNCDVCLDRDEHFQTLLWNKASWTAVERQAIKCPVVLRTGIKGMLCTVVIWSWCYWRRLICENCVLKSDGALTAAFCLYFKVIKTSMFCCAFQLSIIRQDLQKWSTRICIPPFIGLTL
jgi:hypothetical protein